jgi:RHS repeat-associated protein
MAKMMFSKRRTFPERVWRWPAFLTAGVLVVAGLQVPAGAALAAPNPVPHASAGKPVTAVKKVPVIRRHLPDPAARNYVPTRTALPTASRHTIAVGSAAGPITVRAVPGSGAPADVTVSVLDQAKATAAGVAGVLFQVAASGPAPSTGGKVRVGVNYGDWAQAYGGNYASRLQLIAYPPCVLTTPARAACRQGTALPTANSAPTQTLAASVSLEAGAAPTVLAAAAASGDDGGGNGGTYGADTLKAEGSWSSGGTTGSFAYSYPIATPASTTELAPQLALSYDSATVDGETAATQAQASMVGDGWSMPRSYIEQSFVSCADNPEGTASPTVTGDRCYAGPVLTLSLNGASTSLVLDKSGTWKAQNDTGAVIKHVTGTNNGTATYNTDQWTVTERDGTVYTFGMNHLPGWASGKTATNSVDYIPVYSAHDPNTAGKGWTDPCYNKTGTGFANSVCTMAYRWNLDYVKDLHGDAMGFYYTQKTNAYGQNNGATTGTYVRDSYLDHIDYGFTDGNAYGTVADRIVFKNGNRCVDDATTCASLTATTKAHWPDVPFDLICSASCSAHRSPSMFSTERLTSIVTQQYSSADSKYLPVDTYALGQTIPAINGNATTPTLWLGSITHTGNDLAGSPGESGVAAITLPATTFTAVALPNRVDTSVLPAFFRNRLASITTESGAQISPSYKLAKSCAVPVTVAPASNTTSCFPVSWTPAGYTAPILDWFAKYSVDQVTEHSPTGGSPDVTTGYQYDRPAWHYDDNELVKAKYRTYGQFRGFGDVKTFVGDGNTDRRTEAETVYYQGMSKNNNATVVNLTDSQGGVHEDLDQLAGSPLETITYQGENGPVDHSTITSYWVSAATATRDRTTVGLPALTATVTAPAETYARQAVTSTGSTTWRYLETDNTYDASITSHTLGLLQRTYRHTVPAQAAYDSCASTIYAPVNITENLVGLAAETETDAVACAGFTEASKPSTPASLNSLTAPNVNRPAQVIADARTFYDDTAFDTTFPQPKAPTKADVTMTQRAAGYSGGAFQYQTVSKVLYDSYGRVKQQYDGRNNSASMTYTTSAIGLTTAVTATDAMTHKITTTYDPARALTVTATDANGIVTTVHSDALGRTTKVWKYSRTTSQPANNIYLYTIQNNGTAAVTTQTMDDESHYVTSTVIDDALMRPRQTQTVTPKGGRMVTDTLYDTRGWVSLKNNGWWDPAGAPGTGMVQPRDTGQPVPNQDALTYDGLGRVVTDTKDANFSPVAGQVTTTVYNGDRTTVIPPAGGLVQTTIADPLGRTTELDQYSATNPSVTAPGDTFTGHFTVTPVANSVQPTFYGYDTHGNQDTITQGTGGPAWTTTFNLLGQVINTSDPDAGNTDRDGTGTPSRLYDGDGNITQSTDAAGHTVSYTYDSLNRKTGIYETDLAHQSPGAAGNQVRAWVYDNSNNALTMNYATGKLTTQTAYWNHQPYTIQQKNFTIFGGSTGQIVTIPAATEGVPLGTSYTFNHSYTTTNGMPYQDTYPAAGGLPAETVTHTYATDLDLPDSLGSNLAGYQTGTLYDAWGNITQSTLGVTPNQAVITNTYDLTLGRLNETKVTRSTGSPATVDDETYGYDPSGNLTKQVSTRLASANTSETRCFGYNSLVQLTTAWTATDDCKTTPTASDSSMVGDNLGAASAYWTSWTIDTRGDRTSQTVNAFTGGPASSITTTYQYNGNGAAQPHTLTSTSTTGGGSTSYRYDKTGNMTARNAAQGNQTLTYDDLGELTQISGGTAGTTSYRYDADGGLLVQQDPTSTVLYLPGEQITLTGTSTNGVRYIGLPGGAVAVRTGTADNAFSFELADSHGTPSLYLDSTAQTPTWRQFTPYGEARGAAAAVPDNRSFLNKTLDPSTGLIDVGAREYDPTIGRFTTLDPILEPSVPGLLNGYSYTANNPIGQSDPSGLDGCATGGQGCIWYPQCHCYAPPGGAGYKNPPTPEDPHSGGGDGHRKRPPSKCNLSCTLNKPAPHDGIPTHSMPGYADTDHGAYTYGDAIHYAQGSEAGYMFVCIHTFGHSDDYCQHSDPWTKPHVGKTTWKSVLAGALTVGGIVGAAFCIAMPEGCAVALGNFVMYGGGADPEADAAALDGLMAAAGSDAAEIDSSLLAAFCLAPNSFTPDTPVLMADGSTKKIKDVKQGDAVLTTDPDTGETSSEKVTAQHDKLDHAFTDIEVKGAGGKIYTIHTTANHPFWDATARRWVIAGRLSTHDTLVTPAGTHVRVVLVIPLLGTAHMLNLTVAHVHTYYVLAGNIPVLVHNSDGFVVPDDYVIMIGGKPDPTTRDEVFSGNMGADDLEAAGGLPHGSVYRTTAGEIRAGGGTVTYAPEETRAGATNYNHVNITLGSSNPFGDNIPNPSPKGTRGTIMGKPRC